jgi:Uma2 family endonuclease
VVNSADDADERYSDRFYLVAEVVSASDRKRLQLKRRMYKQHENCTCVLASRQDRYEVRVDRRTQSGWGETLLQRPNDVLVPAEFSLHCTLAELYSDTPVNPRQRP